jgi:hypothetical protein
MKLRIKGNTLRLRLTRGEVATLGAGGRVEDALTLGTAPDARLTYAIESCGDAIEVAATMAAGTITVVLPLAEAARWAGSETVGIAADVPNDAGAVHVLVEKDFACLGRDDADADAFPNPGAARC